MLTGEVHCHVLYRREGEYAVAEMAVPFRVAVEGASDDRSVDCRVPVCRVSLARDGSALRMDAEIELSARCCRQKPARVLHEASFAATPPVPRADLEVCYPADSDTLWEVGKRYGVSPDALAVANGISSDAPGTADSLVGVRYLLIPKQA